MKNKRMVVAGGGAAGFFAAIACAENLPDAGVVILEKSTELLAKVAISGGGRCNVTNACFDPKQLAGNYPRGGRELIGAFHRWQPRDTIQWFETRGVKLKTEADGRVFPGTDKSDTIVSCLMREAVKAGIEIRTKCGIASVEKRKTQGFRLTLSDGESLECDCLLLATGGNQNSGGHATAASLGHEITPLVPSLFTFNISDKRLRDLPGISVGDVSVSVPDAKLAQRGPLLITHWGLSGPAILKLSAWGARILSGRDYEFELVVNWLPGLDRHALLARLHGARDANRAKQTGAFSPVELPARLWKSLIAAANVDAAKRWTAVANRDLESIADALHASRFHVAGKSMFKEEFVTCGGVSLREVDFQTMESKLSPGLFFAGEILDIDGVTGGFNFQAAWNHRLARRPGDEQDG